MYNMYDEDNPDLEEEMYLNDMMEDEEYTYVEDSSFYELIEEPIIPKSTITKEFIKDQLSIKIENKRTAIKFTDSSKIYEGIVIAKFKESKYIWDVIDVSSGETKRKPKMFDLKKIKRI